MHRHVSHRPRPGWRVFLLALLAMGCQAADNPLRWEQEVRAFEEADRVSAPPPRAVLFTGSSSIRLWTNIQAHFPGHTVISRGIGGSRMSELNHYIPRLVIPYSPRHVLVYEGDNDIAAGVSPRQILADFQHFAARVKQSIPSARISFIAIKPSRARWHLRDRIRETNGLVKRYARWTRKVDFIDTHTPMLKQDGSLRENLFLDDGLHLNAEGYRLWADVIRRRLAREPAPPHQH